jgi:hypothetical protein
VDKQRRYALNAAGDFYVADGLCIACTAPEHLAGYHCYFKRQPGTALELQRAVMAVAVGCCGSVRYGGTDPVVLERLAELHASDACDHRQTSG